MTSSADPTPPPAPPPARLYLFLRDVFVRPWLHLMCRPQVIGKERLPMSGPLIIAANHQTAGETVLVPGILRRQLSFAAKNELFTAPGLGRVLGWFLLAIGVHPLDRSGGRRSADSMQQVARILAGGAAMVVFPEGTRSPDGRLYKGKTGVARLALGSGARVVPLGLLDTRPVRRWPLPLRLAWRPKLIIGEPLDFSQWRDGANDAAVLRHVTDEVMAAIQRLTGQTYVDQYAEAYKRTLDEGTATGPGPVRPRPGEGRSVPAPPVRRDLRERGNERDLRARERTGENR